MWYYFKKSFFKAIMYSPIVLGIVFIIFIWFIQLPYTSSLYYCSVDVFCLDCNATLGTDATFCPVCSQSTEKIAAVNLFAHCDYCEDNSLYKNEIPDYCRNCGNVITKEGVKQLQELGFTDIKQFRNALYSENIKRLFSNKIFSSILVIVTTKLLFDFVVQLMTYIARRKILKEGKDRFN